MEVTQCRIAERFVNDELERMQKDAFVTHFSVLPRNLFGVTEENNKVPQS